MARFVVAGVLDCINFAHIDYVTQHLVETLPNFRCKRMVLSPTKWDPWIKEINRQNNWNHFQSPIIWREPGMSGGKKHLIGGSNEFWEHCYEYYGLTSTLTKEEKELLTLDVLKHFLTEEEENRKKRKEYRCRRITIAGAGSPMAPLLVAELLRTPELRLSDGAFVQLYDKRDILWELTQLAKDFKGLGAETGLGAVRIVESLAEGLYNCDLLIILEGCRKQENEELEPWLRKNKELMTDIGETLNSYAPPGMRVVYAAPGNIPTCFNTTVLADVAGNLDPRNIVAVTADLGIEAKKTIRHLINVEPHLLGCPPVWGFIGLNKFVDLHNAYKIHTYFEPNVRALKKVPNSTLPIGTYERQTRLIGPWFDRCMPDMWRQVQAHKDELESCLDRPSFLAKVKATIDLLTNWYTDDEENRLVLCIGVLSNEKFGIPLGMYFSQPVYVKDGFWEPISLGTIPLPCDRAIKLRHLFPFAVTCLKMFNIGARLHAPWTMTEEEIDAYRHQVQEKKMEKIREKRAVQEKIEQEKRLKQEAKKEALIAMDKMMEDEIERRMKGFVIELTLKEIVDIVLDTCAPFPPIPIKEPELPEPEEIEEQGEVEEEEEEEEDD